MEIIFRAEKLLEIVLGTKARPAPAGPEQEAWNDSNAKAMLLVSTAMEFNQLQTVMACQTAKDMWDRLKIIHEQRSAVNKVALKQQFFSYKMSESDTIAQHISKIESMSQALSDVGEPIAELDKIAKILGGLPAKYGSFVTAWDSYDENKQTFDNLTARLLKEKKRLSQVEEVTTAFSAIKVDKVDKVSNKTQIKASYLNKQNKRSVDKTNVECYFCHKKGHFKSECRKLLSRQSQDSQNVGLSAEINNSQYLEADRDNFWLADSAASSHMTGNKEWFSTLKLLKSKISIQIGNNEFVYAEAIGSVEIMALVNNKWEPRTLEKVLYTLDLKKNLFSVGATINKGFKVSFNTNGVEIRNERLIATGIRLGNQCFKMLFKMVKLEQANCASTDLALLWHKRMGHVHFATLKEMANNNLIPNLKLNSSHELFCESC